MIRMLLPLLALTSPVHAETALNGAQITERLSGNTAIARISAGTPWRQHFAEDGTTRYYSGSRPASLGKWEVRGDEYCSLWPPARAWECYEVRADGAAISWHRQGAVPDTAILYAGDRTLGPLPPTHASEAKADE
ncbi:MAG: hypothetical protein AAFY73_10715 [Pseudomonadota bacterium]